MALHGARWRPVGKIQKSTCSLKYVQLENGPDSRIRFIETLDDRMAPHCGSSYRLAKLTIPNDATMAMAKCPFLLLDKRRNGTD